MSIFLFDLFGVIEESTFYFLLLHNFFLVSVFPDVSDVDFIIILLEMVRFDGSTSHSLYL